MVFNNVLGGNIRRLRLALRLTQAELGVKLNKGTSTVRMWELGKSQPDNDTLILLAKIFDTSTDYLLGHLPGEENATFDEARENIKNFLGDADIVFRDAKKKLTPEQLKIMLALYDDFTKGGK